MHKEEIKDLYYGMERSVWEESLKALSDTAVEKLICVLDMDEVECLIEGVEHRSIRMPFAEEACEKIYNQII